MRGPPHGNAGSSSFACGVAADMAVGKAIEGKCNLSTDGSQVIATQIKCDH